MLKLLSFLNEETNFAWILREWRAQAQIEVSNIALVQPATESLQIQDIFVSGETQMCQPLQVKGRQFSDLVTTQIQLHKVGKPL